MPDGAANNVDLGIINNQAYCQNDPDVYVPRNNYGEQVFSSAALLRFPYLAGTNFTNSDTGVTSREASAYSNPAPTSIFLANELGTTWGIAYQRTTGRLFHASFFKRHFGFRDETDPTTPSRIYVTNPVTQTIVSTFNVPGITLNSHLVGGTTYEDDGGNVAWSAVGKQSLGGMDISDDEQSLFVMNLENRTLYRLNAATGASTGSVLMTDITLPTPGGTAANCVTDDKRPFAVKFHQGVLYLGMVCSAESTNNRLNLRAYVFTANPTTLVVNSTPVVNIPLNYTRGMVSRYGSSISAAWNPWVPTFTASRISGETSYPQPVFKGITFQGSNMIIGIADRFGDQVGYQTRSNPASTNLLIANSAGDTLKLCGSAALGWNLEINGRCGNQGTAPQNSNQGPSGAEFFFQDQYAGTPINAGHEEVTSAGIDVIPGVPQVISTVYDPVEQNTVGGFVDWAFTQGIRFLNTTTGATDRAYYIPTVRGSKGNDLGQVVAACRPAPLQIGNLVWMDTNVNGRQDPQELGVAGVTVQLFAGGVLVGTAVTDANGNYIFGGPNNTNLNPGISILPNTAYTVVLPASNFGSGGPLEGRLLTLANNDGSLNGDSRDSDGVRVGSDIVIALTTGNYGENNHTYDFGFVTGPTSAPIEVSGRAVDANGRGIRNAVITITSKSGDVHLRAVTSTFGYYQISGLSSGTSYAITVSHNNYSFVEPVRILTAQSKFTDIDFVANPPVVTQILNEQKDGSKQRIP